MPSRTGVVQEAGKPHFEGFAGCNSLAFGIGDAEIPELFKCVEIIDTVGNGMDMLICSDFLNSTQKCGRGTIAAQFPGQAAAEFDVAGQDAAQMGE